MIREFGTGEVFYLVLALRWTVMLSAIAFVGGGLLGLALTVLRVAPWRPGNWLVAGYVQLFQGTPLLMQLFVFYFGFGIFGLDVPAIVAASAALILYAAAFLAEIWRGCIQAIPKGQWEAARALGLRFLPVMWLVVLPQAVRIAVPPTVGFLVQLVKNTSLASIVGYVELTRAGQVINNATFQPFSVFAVVALLYFALCWPLSVAARRLERRLAPGGPAARAIP
ncbi:MAG: amino acid ABC transporter permease [Alphaproteobacteria bacterium]